MFVLIAILVGAAIALAFPGAVLWFAPALRPSFAVTMFLVGTLVGRSQLRGFRSAPLRPVVGLLAQYTIMPMLAFAISLAFDDPVVRTGIVLVGCMPGAMASNVMTLLLGGDLMLSVAMTAAATLCTPIILALWLPLLADTRLSVPVAGLAWNATWMVVLPVAAGITVRHLRPSLPRVWDQVAATAASAAIVLIVLVVVAKNRSELWNIGAALGLAMLALNLGGYGAAYLVGCAIRWPAPQRRTLVVEVGMQNAGLGSVLALTHMGPTGAVPSALYTALCVVTAAAALPLLGRPPAPDAPAGHDSGG